MNKTNFTLNQTFYTKGIAIILMIFHHLFWDYPNIGIEFGGMAVSQRIGIIGKVCVSIFVILSGVGLYYTSSKERYIKFYSQKITKLYANYLFIVITSFIISLVLFKDAFFNILGGRVEGIIKIILTISGFHYLIGYQGINAAWWFVTLIIILYLLFPILNNLLSKYNNKLLIFLFFMSFISIIPLGKIKILEIVSWLFPFVLGMYIAKSNILFRMKQYINLKFKLIKNLVLISIFLFLLFVRSSISPQGIIAIKIDYFIAFLIIYFVYCYYNYFSITKNFIIYLGKRSMEIFYVHMFISNYYLKDLIYGFKNPIFMVIIVLIISLLWAEILVLLRNIIKFDDIIKKISNKIEMLLNKNINCVNNTDK